MELDLIYALTTSLSKKALITLYESLERGVIARRVAESKLILKASPPTKIDEQSVDRKDIANGIEYIIREEEKKLPSESVAKLTHHAFDATYVNLNSIRQERLRQARATFNTALSLTIIGVLIIFSGIILIFAGKLSAGVITTSIGGVTQIVSALLFRFNSESNNRLDEIGKDLHILDKARLTMNYIEQISDDAKKDKAIAALAKDIHSV